MTEQEFEAEYADLGATTQNAMDIAETSMDIVRQFVPDETLETASDKRRSIQWATLNSST